MIIGFVGNDMKLIEEFRKIDSLEGFNVYMSVDDINDRPDCLFVSDKFVDVNKVVSSRSSLPQHVFFMVSNENFDTNIKALLKANNIFMVPPKFTNTQIVELLLKHVLNSECERNNIITFFGADHKVGTTMIAQAVAEDIAFKHKKKVFLGFLNGRPSDLYISGVNNGLDSIKAKLMNNVLDSEELLSVLHNVNDNLYVLKGVDNFLDTRQYKPEHIEYLINQLKDMFDLIVLDAGSNVDLDGLAVSIAALRCTSFRYLVTTQSPVANLNFLHMVNMLKELNIDNFLTVINKYMDVANLDSVEDILKTLNHNHAATVPYSDFGLQCEYDRCSLLHIDSNFCTGIDKLTGIVLTQIGIDIDSSPGLKPSLYSRLKKIFS